MTDDSQRPCDKNIRYLNRADQLSHHRLRVWHKARKFLRLANKNPIGDAELRNQATKAAKSVGCNIAEGAAHEGASRKRPYRIARGSAVEVVAAYELAEDCGESVALDAFTHVGAAMASMLTGLIRRQSITCRRRLSWERQRSPGMGMGTDDGTTGRRVRVR